MGTAALIGTIISLAGSAYGGYKNAQVRKKQQREHENRKAEIDNTFNREYYQDYLEREQSKSFLSKLREGMKDATKVADNSQVVTGGTQESTIAKKSALQKNYAGAVNQLAGMASRHKDSIRNWYENAKNGVYAEKQNMLNHSANQWGNFMGNAMNASSAFAGMIDTSGKGSLNNKIGDAQDSAVYEQQLIG